MLLEALDEVHRINGLRRAGVATGGDAQVKCPGFVVRNEFKTQSGFMLFLICILLYYDSSFKYFLRKNKYCFTN